MSVIASKKTHATAGGAAQFSEAGVAVQGTGGDTQQTVT